ncbi:MAG TPA: ATP-binding protein, partial [Chitinophagaceae bacterium]|nr:ATP-binding protein [Chitinophagaceae bacterium]
MNLSNIQKRFTNFLLFAIGAILVNLVGGTVAGYGDVFSFSIYCSGVILLAAFILLNHKGYIVLSKILASLFFNAFFFTFTYYYGLRSLVFIYYFPFLVSFIYIFKDHGTRAEVLFLFYSCGASIVGIFLICTMNGVKLLEEHHIVVMYKKNFIVSFMLASYYFYVVFSFLIRQNNRLQQQKKLAEEASLSKARFLSIMSHELRTPLNGIIGTINLMDGSEDEIEKKRFQSILKTSSQHLLHLVNNVLDYSKASEGKMELSPVPCRIDQLLQDLYRVFQTRYDEKGLAFELHAEAGLQRSLLVDDVRLVQVLTNLLSNALKFTDKGKVILEASLVSPGEQGLNVTFSVTDTGQGLTDEQQARMFDSFNNVSHQKRNVESTGLGLAISRMIIQKMGAELGVLSRPGKGSRFFFSVQLPYAPAEVQQAPAAQPDLRSTISG